MRALDARGYDVIATVLNEGEKAALLAQVPAVSRIELVDLGDGDAATAKLMAICASVGALRAAICCAGFAKASFVELASPPISG